MEQANKQIPKASGKGGVSVTYGELITRLCQLRDEMNKTEPGRAALRDVERRLGFSPESYEDYGDEPVEWVKEEPEGCSFCDGREPLEEIENIFGTSIASSWCGKYLRIPSAESDGYRRCFINFCPICGCDLRGT